MQISFEKTKDAFFFSPREIHRDSPASSALRQARSRFLQDPTVSPPPPPPPEPPHPPPCCRITSSTTAAATAASCSGDAMGGPGPRTSADRTRRPDRRWDAWEEARSLGGGTGKPVEGSSLPYSCGRNGMVVVVVVALAGLVFLRSGWGREWKSEDFEGCSAYIYISWRN